jgi:pimeloyl-ACP methyl ester carboxylesterase
MKSELEAVATHVEGVVITGSGHWIMEEQPQQAVTVITTWLGKK